MKLFQVNNKITNCSIDLNLIEIFDLKSSEIKISTKCSII